MRQKIGNPYDSTAPAGPFKNLHGRVVVRRAAALGGPDKASGRVIQVDDRLADFHAIAKCHYPRVRLDSCRDHKPGH